MIFESAYNTTNWDAVQESPYEVGLEGALMHVYENECNYNAIMKAAGIAELAYFKENGGDLFVQEASAGTGLIDRFIAFFNKVKEKIKQMCKKFVMKLTSLAGDDKKWAKKYRSQILSNFKAFKFNGYPYPMTNPDFDKAASWVDETPLDKIIANKDMYAGKMTSDDMDKKRGEMRASMCGESGEIDTKEFKDKMKTMLYGESKEDLEITTTFITTALNNIENISTDVKNAQDAEKKLTDKITKYVDKLGKARAALSKNIGGSSENPDSEAVIDNKSTRINDLNDNITLNKDICQMATQAYGAYIGALKDRNRQNKAICVKALNSASNKRLEKVGESAEYDIFANVNII